MEGDDDMEGKVFAGKTDTDEGVSSVLILVVRCERQ
jgi:hypothetical protein